MAVSVGKFLLGGHARFQCVLRSCYAAQSRCFVTEDKKNQWPKKPPSGYIKFLMDSYKEVRAANPNLNMKGEVFKEIGVKWRTLPEAQRKDYLDKQAIAMAQYVKEKEAYLKSLSPQDLIDLRTSRRAALKKRAVKRKQKQSKKLGKPRGRTSPYTEFVKEMAPFRDGVPLMEYSQTVGKKWRGLTEEDKERFVTLAEQKNKVFEQTLRQWEDKMIREGHPELVRVKHRPKPPRKPRKTKRRKPSRKRAAGKAPKANKKKKPTKAKRGGKSVAKKKTKADKEPLFTDIY